MKRLLALLLALCGLWLTASAEGIPGDAEPPDIGELQPVEPPVPEDPEDPEAPENPGDPDDPENPEDPEDPDDPEDPEDPEDPDDPEDPEDPEDPDDPEDPEDPEDPDDPEDPEPPADSAAYTFTTAVTLVDADAVTAVTTSNSIIRVNWRAGGWVRMRITGPDDRVVYETLTQVHGDRFVSGDVYLPLRGGSTAYTLTLSNESDTRTVTVLRTQPFLSDAMAWAGSLPLSAITGRDGGERLALIPCADGSQSFPLVAVGLYTLGEATCTVAEGALTVTLDILPEARAHVRESAVRVAFTADGILALHDGGPEVLSGVPDDPIPLPAEGIAAVWVELRLSLDPAALAPAPTDPDPDQLQLWQQMENGENPLG